MPMPGLRRVRGNPLAAYRVSDRSAGDCHRRLIWSTDLRTRNRASRCGVRSARSTSHVAPIVWLTPARLTRKPLGWRPIPSTPERLPIKLSWFGYPLLRGNQLSARAASKVRSVTMAAASFLGNRSRPCPTEESERRASARALKSRDKFSSFNFKAFGFNKEQAATGRPAHFFQSSAFNQSPSRRSAPPPGPPTPGPAVGAPACGVS